MFCLRTQAPLLLFFSLLLSPYSQAQSATDFEQTRPPTAQNTAMQRDEETPLISDQNSARYIQTLQHLYLSQQIDEALLMHINSLLHDFSLRPKQPIGKTTLSPLARYSLSHDQRGNLVTSRQLRSAAAQQSTISTARIHVYGIDPFVSYRCAETSQSCWLRSPIHGEPWLEISKNEEGAKELAYAITLLIKHLQKDGQGKAR